MVYFSSDWFDKLAKNNFENVIVSLYREKQFKYLEIGTFEGASLYYLLNNCPNCQAFVIDPFDNFNGTINQLQTFKDNLKEHLHKITIIKGYSKNYLPTFEENTFDCIYVDGDHTSYGVLIDAFLSFPLLKSGGYMIFDDYMWIHNDGSHQIPDENDPRLQDKLNPHTGINIFLSFYKENVQIFAKNWQLIIKKI